MDFLVVEKPPDDVPVRGVGLTIKVLVSVGNGVAVILRV